MDDSLIGEDVVLESSSQKLKNMIKKVVVKAKRTGIWWTLSKVEQGILSLSSKLEIRFKSMSLLRAIVGIIRRIFQLTSFTQKHYLLGLNLAYRMVKYAVSVGYAQAKGWLKDRAYIVWWGMFLTAR